jgi:DNA-binding NarL/FixJ family response regulator
VVGEASEAGAALRLLRRPSDALLVDLNLQPSMDGALAVIAAAAGAGRIVIATSAESVPEHVLGALRAGAVGYLTKDVSAEGWATAIRAAVRGEVAIPRSLTGLVLSELRALRSPRPMAELLPSERRLTRREWQVLAGIAEGKTNRAVAAELFVSIETVRTHVSHILAKLEAPNRSAAAAMFRELEASQSA